MAEQGDVDKQYNLGLFYADGRGEMQENNKVTKMYEKLASQGDTHAKCSLGFIYICGLGVRQDNKKAIELYTKAAEQGNSKAQFLLGFICLKVLNDRIAALKWITLANGSAIDTDLKKLYELIIRTLKPSMITDQI